MALLGFGVTDDRPGPVPGLIVCRWQDSGFVVEDMVLGLLARASTLPPPPCCPSRFVRPSLEFAHVAAKPSVGFGKHHELQVALYRGIQESITRVQ